MGRPCLVSGSVIVLGGWRGYRSVARVGLAGGEVQAFDAPYAPGEALAWPIPVRLGAEPASAARSCWPKGRASP